MDGEGSLKTNLATTPPFESYGEIFRFFSGKKRRTPIPAEIQMGRTTEFSTNGKLNLFLEKFQKLDTPSQLSHHQLSLKNGTVPFSHFSF